MKILLAKNSGFCMGVRRAVEMVLDTSIEQTGPIYTFGPLIHNPQVLRVLEEKGIQVLDEVPEKGTGTVLIRAHGVPPAIKTRLREAGFNVLDATCPRVVKIQTIIRKYAKRNHSIIIVGDQDHPEVIGLLGYANGHGFVVSQLEQLEDLPSFQNAIVVAQTTQNKEFFENVKGWIQVHHPHYQIVETICDATEKRQRDVKRLSESVDAILVVGGSNSGNTRRLAEIAEESGKPVFHIEAETDLDALDLEQLASTPYIGLTAGASTPNWIIKKVYRALEQLPYKQRRGWRRYAFTVQRALLLTNIYVALGAGCLSYACLRLLGMSEFRPFIVIALLYVLSMHTLNHLIGAKADKYNDPDRAAFYEKHKLILTLMAVGAGAAGLLTALALGPWPFLILLTMSITGLSYNLKLLPDSVPVKKGRRIRDLPGSKTILISMAWGVLAAVLPSIAVYEEFDWLNFFLFFWSTGLVFVRTSFFDILDMQGDRIIGKETMAIILGERQMMGLLEIILAGLIVTLPLVSALKLDGLLGTLLALCPVCMLVILAIYKNGYLLPGIRLEFLVETIFILAGILTVLSSFIG